MSPPPQRTSSWDGPDRAETATVPPQAPPDATAATLPPAPPAPEGSAGVSVPGYEILGVLGRGGMGVVYQARQVAADRLVALKMILGGGHADAAMLARFRTEAQAVARLQHPGIVQVFEVGEHQGLPYFSLEYVEGGSLDRKLNGTPLPPDQAARLVGQIARAVHAAHDQHLVHRDLKPANVLLTSDGQPKVTDFGLAKTLDREQGHTATGAIMGTPSYMAPEQASGNSKAIGPAADVYALGAILYECLTGRPPFRAATPLDTILQVVADEPVSPRTLNLKIPRDMDTICLKCLRKEPGKRYASAAALADDLRRFRKGEPIRARSVGTGERVLKWVRRRPATAGLLAVSGTAALLLLLSGVFFTINLNEARQRAEDKAREALQVKQQALQQRDRAEWLVYAARIEKAQRAWQDNDADVAFQALNACRPDLRGWEHDYLTTLFNRNQKTFRGHTRRIWSVAFSPDGKRIVSGSEDRTVKVWDALTGQVLHSFSIPGHAASVAYSSDGKRIACGLNTKQVIVWDAVAGAELLTFTEHDNVVNSIAFSSDSQRLASCSFGVGKVWDAASGRLICNVKFGGHAFSIAFSPDGKTLAGGSQDNWVRTWDATTGRELLTLKGHTGSVRCVAFSSDGKRLASASVDKTLKVWDTTTGQELLTFTGHTDGVTSVAFSPDDKFLVSSGGLVLKIWNAATAQEIRTLKGHTAGVYSVAYSPDGKRIVSGSHDNTVRVWSPAVSQQTLTLKGHRDSVYSLAFHPDGKRLVSGSWDNTLKLWDTVSGRELATFRGHQLPVVSVAFSPDGKRIVSGSVDATVKVWDTDTGRILRSLPGHQRQVTSVAFSSDGKRIASGSEDFMIRVWDASSGENVLRFHGHFQGVSSLAFRGDGKQIVSGGYDGSVKVWDAATGRSLLSLKGDRGQIHSVAFSSDGKRIVSGGQDRTVKVWDADTGQEILRLEGHRDSVSSVIFSPDGKRIVSASHDKTVRVWDAGMGQEVLTLKESFTGVRAVAFSADGVRLAAGNTDRTIKVWEAAKTTPTLTSPNRP